MAYQILRIVEQTDDTETDLLQYLQGPLVRDRFPSYITLFIEDVMAPDPRMFHGLHYMYYNVRIRNNITGRTRTYPYAVNRYRPDPNVDFVEIRLVGVYQ